MSEVRQVNATTQATPQAMAATTTVTASLQPSSTGQGIQLTNQTQPTANGAAASVNATTAIHLGATAQDLQAQIGALRLPPEQQKQLLLQLQAQARAQLASKPGVPSALPVSASLVLQQLPAATLQGIAVVATTTPTTTTVAKRFAIILIIIAVHSSKVCTEYKHAYYAKCCLYMYNVHCTDVVHVGCL